MENENEITDKTYTLNSENSYFDADKAYLQILLPLAAEENPYTYRAFDISQFVDGHQHNAIFVYMKKAEDDATDLSSYDDDKCECNFTCEYGNMTQVSGLANFSAFDPTAKNALITIYHDTSTDSAYQQTCAEKVFEQVVTIAANVTANGNFQTTLNLMGTDPKKAGMSTFPKK